MKIKSKKADENLLEQVIFIILNVLFFATLLFFAWRSAGADSLIEETYAKKIGLIIDFMKPGTEVRINLDYLYDQTKNNKYNGDPVEIFTGSNEIVIKLKDKGGYRYRYFTQLVSAEIPRDTHILILKS